MKTEEKWSKRERKDREMARRQHKYTELQDQFLRTKRTPSLTNKDECRKFFDEFVKMFSGEKDWTPLEIKPESLVSRAKTLQKFDERIAPVDRILSGYLGKVLTKRALCQIAEKMTVGTDYSFSPEEIEERFLFLTEQAGGCDYPVVSPDPVPQRCSHDKKERGKWMVVLNGETIWERSNRPLVDIARGMNGTYLILGRVAIKESDFKDLRIRWKNSTCED